MKILQSVLLSRGQRTEVPAASQITTHHKMQTFKIVKSGKTFVKFLSYMNCNCFSICSCFILSKQTNLKKQLK